MKPFPFYAQVKVISGPTETVGLLGVIMGRAKNHDGSWGYAVHFDVLDSYDLPHSSLLPTGVQFKRSDFYSGKSIRVLVDENGYGRVLD